MWKIILPDKIVDLIFKMDVIEEKLRNYLKKTINEIEGFLNEFSIILWCGWICGIYKDFTFIFFNTLYSNNTVADLGSLF